MKLKRKIKTIVTKNGWKILKEPKLYAYWHAFHDRLCSALTAEEAADRRRQIKRDKDHREVEFRLKLFKRAKGIKITSNGFSRHIRMDDAGLSMPELEKLHKEQCPKCPWGQGSYDSHIFTAKKWKKIRPYDDNLKRK